MKKLAHGPEKLGCASNDNTQPSLPLPLVEETRIVSASRFILSTVSNNWLSLAYLGPELHLKFSAAPPRLFLEPPTYFTRFEKEHGFVPSGVKLSGTDEIHISSTIEDQSELWVLITHELLHHASELGGGRDISWEDSAGCSKTVKYDEKKWLHEGMTELHAQQLVRKNGYAPTFVAYKFETATSFYIQRLVVDAARSLELGMTILRGAYLTGNFTQIRMLVDRALKKGTFDELMKQSNGAQAFEFLRFQVKKYLVSSTGPPSYRKWDEHPLAEGALTDTDS